MLLAVRGNHEQQTVHTLALVRRKADNRGNVERGGSVPSPPPDELGIAVCSRSEASLAPDTSQGEVI